MAMPMRRANDVGVMPGGHDDEGDEHADGRRRWRRRTSAGETGRPPQTRATTMNSRQLVRKGLHRALDQPGTVVGGDDLRRLPAALLSFPALLHAAMSPWHWRCGAEMMPRPPRPDRRVRRCRWQCGRSAPGDVAHEDGGAGFASPPGRARCPGSTAGSRWRAPCIPPRHLHHRARSRGGVLHRRHHLVRLMP